MAVSLIIAISLHVLAGTFWAGSTFAVARTGGLGAAKLVLPQIAAAAVAILTGAYLWFQLHEGGSGPMERYLGIGAASAIFAIIVQIGVAAPAVRALARAQDDERARVRFLAGSRIAALLLAITTIAMASARYA